jgi:hypothetical protein
MGKPMIKVYNKFGDEIGNFDGSFVFDSYGEKIYWVEGRDVFSVPHKDTESHLARSPCLGIGVFSGETATDEASEIIFVTNITLANAISQPESC